MCGPCDALFGGIARPFGWLLLSLYNFLNSYALALLFVAIIVRALMLPFQMKGKLGMMRQGRLQPKIAELQKKHGANKQKLNEETAKLYKEEGVNPAAGCLWSFIQFPIMIALFYAIRQPLSLLMGLGEELSDLWEKKGILYDRLVEIGANLDALGLGAESTATAGYSEVYVAQEITNNWNAFANLGIPGLQQIYFTLGNINLALTPQYDLWNFDWSDSEMWVPALILFFFPVLSGGMQFLSAHIMRKMSPTSPEAAAAGGAGKVMKFMPLLSVWFGFILPAALSFYWTIGTVLQIGQDIWLTKKYSKVLDAEDEEKEKIRKVKEADIEAKRLETERLKAEGLAAQNRNTSKRNRQKTSRQQRREKAVEWEKKNAPPGAAKDEKYEPSRVGNRRYARGRAYSPDRYEGIAGAVGSEDTLAIENTPQPEDEPDADFAQERVSDDDFAGYDDDTDDTDGADDDDDFDDDDESDDETANDGEE
ncbi:MAG: YidC/Oxa1 family membrane protein insertase [Oscillospiraceae bacterium]|nr:YidC/Oxa1 family membrane protein insertase [Oscillospiraceae bacterium]